MTSRLLLVLAVAAPAGGCLLDEGRTCTLLLPPTGFHVRLMLGDEGLYDSTYDFIMRADGHELAIRHDFRPPGSCTATPPSPSSMGACVAVVETGSHQLLMEAPVGWGGGGIYLWYGRDELGGPARAELEIRRNGLMLVSTTFTPAYEVVEANGPGCGLSASAYEELTLIVPP
ncbi:MAG: hypothetical protein K8M05_18550 [Deltaproteobacteria bacterium]|nr:hypothetical protein [Kofleriaceae bacterium]